MSLSFLMMSWEDVGLGDRDWSGWFGDNDEDKERDLLGEDSISTEFNKGIKSVRSDNDGLLFPEVLVRATEDGEERWRLNRSPCCLSVLSGDNVGPSTPCCSCWLLLSLLMIDDEDDVKFPMSWYVKILSQKNYVECWTHDEAKSWSCKTCWYYS